MLQEIHHDSQAWLKDERMAFHEALACIAAHEGTAKSQCTHMGTSF
jgi:hypothetical protein